jgi:transketolase
MNHTFDLQRRMAVALRMLAVDAVERASSGHPGAPMGMADIAYPPRATPA